MKKPIHQMTKDEYESHIEDEKQLKTPFSFFEIVFLSIIHSFTGMLIVSFPVGLWVLFGGTISQMAINYLLIGGASVGILFVIAQPIYFWKYKTRLWWALN